MDALLIYVNGAHESVITGFEKDTGFLPALLGPEWKRSPIVACDGSQAYFGVEYDPATGTFSDFLFNVGFGG